jgi:hypothetical protein
MRSIVGVGITPPKVDGAPKPTSSVMISRMFGAPFGGTTSSGQYGFDWVALVLISPLNCCGGGGKYLPSMVVVAPGEPGTPVDSCALAGNVNAVPTSSPTDSATKPLFMTAPPDCYRPFRAYFLDLLQHTARSRRENEIGG